MIERFTQKLLTTCLLVSMITPTVWASGDEINNGGGLGEKNIIQAYLNMNSYIDVCLKSPICMINKNEKAVLENIKESLELEYQNPNQIKFASEKENPGFFIIDGDIKIAKTGRFVQDPIYINTDLLTATDSSNNTMAISLSQAVAILIHEFGHHHNIEDHTFLDTLGIKVSLQLNNAMQTFQLFPNSKKIMLAIFNPISDSQWPQLLLYLDNQLLNISDILKNTANCNSRNGPTSFIDRWYNFQSATVEPLGAKVHNVFWKKFSKGTDTISFELSGRLGLRCRQDDQINLYKANHSISIQFKMQEQKSDKINHWSYIDQSIRIKQTHDPKWSFNRIPFVFLPFANTGLSPFAIN